MNTTQNHLIQVGIVGAAGYTGGELLRILINHPGVNIAFAHSNSQGGKKIYEVHTDLLGETDMEFVNNPIHELTGKLIVNGVLFLCSGHGASKKFFAENSIPDHIKIIDLSTDYRDESEDFIYGLPELQREKIKTATKIANPGCFATGIQLALLPLASAGLLHHEIHVSAVTGSTGAGQALSPTTHFSWRNNNLSVYKAFTHQHLKEINQNLGKLQPGFSQAIRFIPYRGDFTRGIIANVYTSFSGSREEAIALFRDFYAEHPFTHVSEQPIDLKQIVNTNKVFIHLEVHDGQLLVTSIVDNLTKGASGQAVQNMNLMFGLPETMGLRLKAPVF